MLGNQLVAAQISAKVVGSKVFFSTMFPADNQIVNLVIMIPAEAGMTSSKPRCEASVSGASSGEGGRDGSWGPAKHGSARPRSPRSPCASSDWLLGPKDPCCAGVTFSVDDESNDESTQVVLAPSRYIGLFGGFP